MENTSTVVKDPSKMPLDPPANSIQTSFVKLWLASLCIIIIVVAIVATVRHKRMWK